jgi:hypothetical protein
MEAGKGEHIVRIRGEIAGFDGSYPILSVRKFTIDYLREPRFRHQIDLEKFEKDETESPKENSGQRKADSEGQ